jgi:hypothetical protein
MLTKTTKILYSYYVDMRRILCGRGWVENTDLDSKDFDFKWVSKIKDINYS